MKTHEMQVRVRYDDADPMGFLHHSKYLTYFEMGRTELFRASGGDYREMEATGYFVVVVKVECRYVQPARYDDVLTIRTSLTNLSSVKIEHDYVLLRDDLVLAKAHVTLAIVDRAGQVQPVPDWLRELY